MPTNKRHYIVNLGDAIKAHDRALKESGGRKGIHDLGLIESALGRPYNGYYRRIHRKAAALIHSVAGNHGFVDGNKRTALILFHLLLERSGYRFNQTSTRENEDDIEHLILDLTTKFLDVEEATVWLKKRIRPKA